MHALEFIKCNNNSIIAKRRFVNCISFPLHRALLSFDCLFWIFIRVIRLSGDVCVLVTLRLLAISFRFPLFKPAVFSMIRSLYLPKRYFYFFWDTFEPCCNRHGHGTINLENNGYSLSWIKLYIYKIVIINQQEIALLRKIAVRSWKGRIQWHHLKEGF